jgi:hypothetical protein
MSVTNPLHGADLRIRRGPLYIAHVRRAADLRCYGVIRRGLIWPVRGRLGIVLAAARSRNDHLAENCRDDGCPRFPCRMYREGFMAGYRKGYADGEAAGRAAGFAAGYSAGYSAGAATATQAG